MRQPVLVSLAAGYLPAIFAASVLRGLGIVPLWAALCLVLSGGAALTLGIAILRSAGDTATRRSDTASDVARAPRGDGEIAVPAKKDP